MMHKTRTFLLAFLVLAIIYAVAYNTMPYFLANLPAQTWQLKRSDLIIVLGASANKDGTPGSMMRERVATGVKLFKDGIAPFILFTGAAAHTKFVEAELMADLAKSQGVPADCMILESNAHNTAQNAFFSYQLMKEKGLKSAVIVSSPAHLLRSNLFFSRYPISYCMYPAGDPPDMSLWERFCFDQREKKYVLSDLQSAKGVKLGLKPEQAALMTEITEETKKFRLLQQR